MFSKTVTAFIPLFFAIDAIGILPIFMAMTREIYIEKRRRIVNQAVITAFLISVGFIYFGKAIFKFLGITIADFKIAGGILLLLFSINDLLFSQPGRRRASSAETMGVVPIGMPLIIGPAVLTTLLLSVGNNGNTATVVALSLNIVIVWIVFWYSDQVIHMIGEAGATAVGKIFALLMAAIGVMMIRLGIIETVGMFKSVSVGP